MKHSLFIIALCFSLHTAAGEADFKKGPQIKNYGQHAKVRWDYPLVKEMEYKVVFDVSEQGADHKINRSFNSAARFINMHVANGVAAKNIQLALVVHGKASFDLLSHREYQKKFKQDNPNAELLDLLIKNNVKIILCGQSAAYYDIENRDLHRGVKMALSAMTAHATLQVEGYSSNPF